MNYATEYIAKTLKATRLSKLLSQARLGELAGVPQSHISKIENGGVDLRVSSLVELARVLDLELTLVPRKAVSAVNAIVRSTERSSSFGRGQTSATIKELKRLYDRVSEISVNDPTIESVSRLQRQVRDLQRFQVSIPDNNALSKINQWMNQVQMNAEDLDDVSRKALKEILLLRNETLHGVSNMPQMEPPRPAYALEEDDNG